LGVAILGGAAAVFAQVPGARASIVMKSGDRLDAEVIDIAAPGLLIRENGNERNINFGDVAIIEFAAGVNPNRAIAAGGQYIVLRNGEVIDGRLFDIGGNRPKILYVQTSSGMRQFNSDEVAVVHLAAANNVRRPLNQPVGTVGRRGAASFGVAANREWTDTGVMVREGETIALRVDGQIELAPNQRTGAAGIAGGRRGDQTPLPAAPAGALIGRIDEGAPFLIGGQGTVRMPATGRLFLGVNDDVVSDNAGEYQVTIFPSRR
jgi:hypothetical protein